MFGCSRPSTPATRRIDLRFVEHHAGTAPRLWRERVALLPRPDRSSTGHDHCYICNLPADSSCNNFSNGPATRRPQAKEEGEMRVLHFGPGGLARRTSETVRERPSMLADAVG